MNQNTQPPPLPEPDFKRLPPDAKKVYEVFVAKTVSLQSLPKAEQERLRNLYRFAHWGFLPSSASQGKSRQSWK